MRLAPMLAPSGRLKGDLTLFNWDDGTWWIMGSYYLRQWHMRWFQDHIEDGVEIRDLQGRPVRDLSIVRTHPSGLHSVAWDGRDQRGALVAPGMYLARVSFAPDFADDPQADGTEA